MLRPVFFGTPELAVPTLAALVAAGYRPLLVVSQPSRPAGRGGRLREPAVAAWARAHGLEVAQPERVREEAFMARLRELAPDLAVVVAFGQIFRRELLALPRLGCVNLHASLLPAYRGAAPIQAAIAAGERVTGVSTIEMDEGLDTGPVLLQAAVAIGPDETAPELAARLAERGAALVVETLGRLERGDLAPTPQDAARATLAPRLSREHGLVDWGLPAAVLYDRLRGYTPWPGLTAMRSGEPVKLLAVRPAGGATERLPGTVLGVDGEALRVASGGGSVLALERLQRPGRAAVSGADFARGERLASGDRFDGTTP